MPTYRGTRRLVMRRRVTAAVGGLDADYSTWKATVGSVGATQETAINQLIVDLKAASVWTKLDRIWLLSGENTTQARTDLKALANTFTDVGTVAHTANVGYNCTTGNGINTGYTPSTNGVNYTQNSASFGAYLKTGGGANESVMGVDDAGIFSYLEPDGSNANYDINGSSFPGPADTNTSGRYIVSRTASNANAVYRNGSSLGTGAGASSALATIPFYLFFVNGFGHPGVMTLGACWFGGGFNSTEAGAFDTAMAAYQTSIGN